MNTFKSAVMLLFVMAAFATGCKQAPDRSEESAEVQSVMLPERSVSDAGSSSAAQIGKQDSTRKFIRTADLKFKVKNVIQTTYAIENIVARQDGFVTLTKLESVTNRETTNKISRDSSVVTKYFTVGNSMVIRVPNTKLDTTLKAIAPLIDHLDFRIIEAEDVSLRILSNDMSRQRSGETEKRLTDAIDNKGRKLNDITTAEDNLESKKAQADRAKLENLSIDDKVDFSTINIMMYQREEIKREKIANDDPASYSQGFGSKILDAFYSGWTVITTIVVLITHLWAVVLLSVILYFIYRKYRQSRKK